MHNSVEYYMEKIAKSAKQRALKEEKQQKMLDRKMSKIQPVSNPTSEYEVAANIKGKPMQIGSNIGIHPELEAEQARNGKLLPPVDRINKEPNVLDKSTGATGAMDRFTKSLPNDVQEKMKVNNPIPTEHVGNPNSQTVHNSIPTKPLKTSEKGYRVVGRGTRTRGPINQNTVNEAEHGLEEGAHAIKGMSSMGKLGLGIGAAGLGYLGVKALSGHNNNREERY